MKRQLTIVLAILMLGFGDVTGKASMNTTTDFRNFTQDTSRITELNQYWEKLGQTVKEGDFEGYGALYHTDAVVVFAVGENHSSMPIVKALSNWKQGFDDTKAGKANSNVVFRFDQRINDETTAHESGIFHYSSLDQSGKVLSASYIHFEMLLVKKEGRWLGVMEYQKSRASENEWESLKPLSKH